MLARKHKNILYLTRDNIVAYSTSSDKKAEFHLGHDVVEHVELKNEKLLFSRVADFVAKHGLAGTKAILILSDDVIFAKKVDFSSEEVQESKVEEFLSNVPFDRNQLEWGLYEVSDVSLLLAINKKLCHKVVEAFVMANLGIDYVIPESALSAIKQKLEAGVVREVDKLIGGSKVLKKLDLLSEDKIHEIVAKKRPVGAGMKKEKRSIKVPVVVALVAILLVSGAYAVYTNTSFLEKVFLSNLWGGSGEVAGIGVKIVEEGAVRQPSGFSVVEETRESISVSAEKAHAQEIRGLKARILNGTGTPGLAAQVQRDLGLSDSTVVGNYAGGKSTATLFKHKSDVSQDVVRELVSLLEESFAQVNVEVLSDGYDVDVEIVTGDLRSSVEQTDIVRNAEKESTN